MSFVSLMLPDGDTFQVVDPKSRAGQVAWERATQAAIEFAQNPGTVAGAKLLALVGGRSSLGDPTDPDFLEGLSASQRVVALEQLAHAAASWHLESGRNADGTANPRLDGVVTMTPQGEAIISRPVTKAATADALRLAATQAGPQHADFAVRAAIAERETALRGKAAAPARSWRRATDGQVHELAPDGTLAGTDGLLPAPQMLYKLAGSDPVEQAASYRRLAATPGMASEDVAKLVQAATDLERQTAG